jgi:hypothetical protein
LPARFSSPLFVSGCLRSTVLAPPVLENVMYGLLCVRARDSEIQHQRDIRQGFIFWTRSW